MIEQISPYPELMRLTEAAKRLGIKRDQAYILGKTTRELVTGLPILKSGGMYYVSRRAFERVLGADCSLPEDRSA